MTLCKGVLGYDCVKCSHLLVVQRDAALFNQSLCLCLGRSQTGLDQQVCHSDRTGDPNLVDAFAAYLESKGEYDPRAEKRFAPALCNRLDRGTEGLVLAAKSYTALRDLNAIIRDDMMRKEYLTITVGAPPPVLPAQAPTNIRQIRMA